MKRIIFTLLSLLIVITFSLKAQISLEAGGGYLASLNHTNITSHTSGGWQFGGSILYKVSEVLELKSSLNYQSRFFNPNSFIFYVPAVVGISIPTVSGGDNLNSLSFMIGGRLAPKSSNVVKTILDADVGINYFQESYYNLNYVNGETVTSVARNKYSNNKVMFETSFGFGFEITPITNLSVIIEAKANYIPSEQIVYFPIISNIRFGI